MQPTNNPLEKPTKQQIALVRNSILWLLSVVVAFIAGQETVKKQIRDAVQESFAPLAAAVPALRQPAPSPEDISKYEQIEVSPEQLVRKFADNQAAGEDWARGKILVFRAPIESIENDTLGRSTIYVSFEAKFGGVINPSIRVAFDGSFRDVIHALRKGQQVTCGGTYANTGIGTDLELNGVDIHKEK